MYHGWEQILFHSIPVKQKHPKAKKISKNLYFRISGQNIDIVKQTKYIVIYLDEHLTWNCQIQIKSKISRSSGLLGKLKCFVKMDVLKAVYFAIFDSILDSQRYGIQVWVEHRNQTIKDIENVQEKIEEFLTLNGKTIQ